MEHGNSVTLHTPYTGVLAYASVQIMSESCVDCVELMFGATRQKSAKLSGCKVARNWFQLTGSKDQGQTIHHLSAHNAGEESLIME